MDIAINLFALGILVLTIGYYLPYIKSKESSRAAAWLLTILILIYTAIVVAEESPLTRMIAFVSLLMLSMKMLVLNETYTSPRLNVLQWSAFALGWFDMKPVLFERLISQPLKNDGIFLKGIGAVLIGIAFLWISIFLESKIPTLHVLSDLFILLGISLVLHFGILNLSASFWRVLGLNAAELFKSPYKARTLNDFWSKRWNIAFSEMTIALIYHPLKSKFGKTVSLFAAFLFSGVLHEIAISVPVKAGYGLPLLYFFLHAIAMYAENNSTLVKSMLTNRMASHLWVLIWVIIPLPLLFHTPFMNEVLKPLRDIMVSPIL